MRFKKGLMPWNKGKTFSEESKRRMSESHKGQKSWNKGKKGLQVAWNKGKSAPEEIRRKMSIKKKEFLKNNPQEIERLKEMRTKINFSFTST